MDAYKHATSTEIQISEINVVFFFFFWNSLLQDEDVYTFFEPELPCESLALARTRSLDPARTSISMIPDSTNQVKAHQLRKQRSLSTLERSNYRSAAWRPIVHDRMSLPEGSSVLDLKAENFFSCTVSRLDISFSHQKMLSHF
jgi:trehalose 6-phosphate synthase/phosphatase